jgi:hypothetical protein
MTQATRTTPPPETTPATPVPDSNHAWRASEERRGESFAALSLCCARLGSCRSRHRRRCRLRHRNRRPSSHRRRSSRLRARQATYLVVPTMSLPVQATYLVVPTLYLPVQPTYLVVPTMSPAGTGHVPGGTDAVPAGTGHVPGGTDAVPAGTGHVPGGTDAVPAGTGRVRAATDHVPAGTGGAPGSTEHAIAGGITHRAAPDAVPVRTGRGPAGPDDVAAGTGQAPHGTHDVPVGACRVLPRAAMCPPGTRHITVGPRPACARRRLAEAAASRLRTQLLQAAAEPRVPRRQAPERATPTTHASRVRMTRRGITSSGRWRPLAGAGVAARPRRSRGAASRSGSRGSGARSSRLRRRR